jgi:hypothetical protein
MDKEIQFIVLGQIDNLNDVQFTDNVKILELGFRRPIPRSLFQHLDAVIAGAGCASIAARENVPTIVADPGTFLSNGIMGYEIKSTLFSEKNGKLFEESLEDVLVKKIHLEMTFEMPDRKYFYEEYEKHFDFIKKSEQVKEYFDFEKNPQPITFKEKTRFVVGNYMPVILKIYRRIKIKG